MLNWLLIGVVLYYAQVFLPAIFRFLNVGMAKYVGSRDDLPPLAGVPARLERATENMKENFPVFATLAVAALALDLGADGQIILGAQIFIIARLVYVPLYALAVPMVRSLFAVGGWTGLAIMALGLTGGAV